MKLPCLLGVLFAFSLLPVYAETSLKGTGSSLSAPLYSKWIGDYGQAQSSVKIRYEAKDSEEGVKKALERGSDFTVSDTSFNMEEEHRLQSRSILRLPTALEAVAITYNLPGIPTGLKLSSPVLSDIFLGVVKKWNDPALRELNPGLALPDMDIRVVYREEENSLHDLFPAFLSRLNPKWTAAREKEKRLHWPPGQKVKGNEKVFEKLRLWPGVIAAVDLSFAAQKNLPVAALRNASGQFVEPSVESLMAAASDFPSLPEDFQVNLSQSRAKQAYPLSSFSYLLVYQDYRKVSHDPKKGQAMGDFLNWVLGEGQKKAAALSYAPLPEGFLAQVKEKLQTFKY